MKKIAFTLVFTAIAAALTAQVSLQWSTIWNGEGDFNDRFTCLTRDATGNLYAGGSTTNPGEDRDFLLVKYAPSGARLWARQFRGTGTGADEIRAIALDPQGNVCITGLSSGAGTGTDFLTIALTPAGDTIWTRRYDFTGEYDQPNAICTDAAGAIYVTGQSDSDPSDIENDDFATLKYAPNGALIWAKRYDGFGHSTDRPVAMVWSSLGFVFVAGRADNGSNDDCATVAYDAATGAQEWFRLDDRGHRDRAEAMTLAADGSLAVAARSSNGSNDDFWTLKISPAGILLWEKTFDFVDQDRPTAIAAGPDGKIFITGQSDQDANAQTNWDFLTVAYSSTGSQLWAMRQDGSAKQDDLPLALAATSDGSLFVVGRGDRDPSSVAADELICLKYATTNGQFQWRKALVGGPKRDNAANAVLALPNGGCVLAGFLENEFGRRDAAIFQLAPIGATVFENKFSGTGDNSDNVHELAKNAQGQLFAAGYSVGGDDNRNMNLLTVNTQTGAVECQFAYTGDATGSVDDAAGIATDVAGNPVLAGTSRHAGQTYNMTVFGVGAACDSTWHWQFDGAAHGSDRAYDFAPDGQANFLVTGRTDDAAGAAADDNCLTAKISATGQQLWAKNYDSGSGQADRGVAVAANAAGEVFVVGRTLKTGGLEHDIFLVKYGATGGQKWLKIYDDAGKNTLPVGLALDAQGNAIVVANLFNDLDTTAVSDILVLKYNTGGTLVWAKTWDGGHGRSDLAQALAVDNLGNVVVAASSDAATAPGAQDFDFQTIKYDAAGNVAWASREANPNSDDSPDALAVNAAGQIYLTGHTANAGPNQFDITSIILAPDGQRLWQDTWNSPADSADVPNALLLDGKDFYIGGSTFTASGQRDVVLLKYSGMAVGTDEAGLLGGAVAVFPNPFDRELHVSGLEKLSSDGAVFSLFDATGRLVFSKNLSPTDNSSWQMPALPAGGYFWKIVGRDDAGRQFSSFIIHN